MTDKITKFDVDQAPDIEKYNAYVYRISVSLCHEQKVATEKIYIGAHFGSIYDPYDFSSEDEEFQKDLINYLSLILKYKAYSIHQ